MKPPKIAINRIRYFPVSKHWRKLRPHFQSKPAEEFWRYNLRDFSEQKAAEHKFKYRYDGGRYTLPRDHDGSDWRCDRRGRPPEFWDYVCSHACHFVVDMCLHVAKLAYPKIPWRIVTSQKHSTVWNGDVKNPVLFDLNFWRWKCPPRKRGSWRVGEGC